VGGGDNVKAKEAAKFIAELGSNCQLPWITEERRHGQDVSLSA